MSLCSGTGDGSGGSGANAGHARSDSERGASRPDCHMWSCVPDGAEYGSEDTAVRNSSNANNELL